MQRLRLQLKYSPQSLLLLRARWDSAIAFPRQICNFDQIRRPCCSLTSPPAPSNYKAQSLNNPRAIQQFRAFPASVRARDRKSGELPMSGRWWGHNSPPHSSPTAELGWGRSARHGLEPDPGAPAPP